MRRYLLGTLALLILGCNNASNEQNSESSIVDPHSKDEHHHSSEESRHGHHHSADTAEVETTHYKEERHLKNVKQLSFGGDNAEAYWSFNDDQLVFQSNNPNWGFGCDQIYIMELDSMTPTKVAPYLVSAGIGRTTCGYFMPGDSTVVYASTHSGSDDCPPEADRSSGRYVWAIYEDYEIYVGNKQGQIISQLTDLPGYDAEATLSPDGTKIVFTSTRSGDLELYTMNLDGSDVVQVTDELGYDGGAFFSPDGTKLVWRASRPSTPEAQKEYKDLLAQGLVEPSDMELFVCDVDGSNKRQVTDLGGANWAPFFHPSGEKIIFCSNHHTGGFPFNLFLINIDGTGLEQVTFDKSFDSFPMFSYSGKHLVFGSNRNNGRTRDTNLFIAEWFD